MASRFRAAEGGELANESAEQPAEGAAVEALDRSVENTVERVVANVVDVADVDEGVAGEGGDRRTPELLTTTADAAFDVEDPEGSLKGPPRIGAYLARQRKLRGISREELCSLTHIPIRSLERLEDGHFDEIDDGFVRGFVRTVAKALGLDQNDTLARMSIEPAESDFGANFAVGVVRVGVILLGLLALLGSVGLVSMTMMPSREPQQSPLVVRHDPVRLLAEAQARSGSVSSNALSPTIEPAPAREVTVELPPEMRAEMRAEMRSKDELALEVRAGIAADDPSAPVDASPPSPPAREPGPTETQAPAASPSHPDA